MIRIRFWWSGYSPEDALTSFDPTVADAPFHMSGDGGRSWRSPRNGTTLQTIQEWMMDHDLTIVDTELVDQRRGWVWQGSLTHPNLGWLTALILGAPIAPVC